MEICAVRYHHSSTSHPPLQDPSMKFQPRLDDPRLNHAYTLESDRQSTAVPDEDSKPQNANIPLHEDEELLKKTLAFYNVVQTGENIMHVSLYATIGAKSLEQRTLLSTMKIVPTDIEDLKEKLSYYQEKLYKRFPIKLTDLVRLETLGKGAFGEVTRVFNKADRDFYALKEVRRESFKKAIYYESAIWTEIQNLLKVTQSHNNSLLKTIMIDFDENQDVCYLLMELGNGTLEEYAECKRKHNMPWTAKELEYVLSQLIGQVLKLKELGMYHRDIKPSNVIISCKEDAFKLSDLGCACITTEGVQKLNVTGTPHFMSPELIQAVMNRQVMVEHDPFASDLYSIGVTILTLLNHTIKRKEFRGYLEDYVKENYPGLYPILRELLGPPEKRRDAVDKVMGTKLVIHSYKQLESVSVGGKYKVYLYCKIVGKNKNIDTSFYFDMFILDDALLVIQKQIFLLTEKMKEGDLNLEEVVWRIRLARCYYLQMKYEEALKELDNVMRRKELKSFESQNVLTKARALLWSGIVKVKLGRIEEAIGDLMHCLGIRVAEFGEVHEDVLAVFWQLGDTYLVQENLSGAHKTFEKGIEIGEKLSAKERKYMAKSFNSLGMMLEKQEKYEEALEYFERAKATAIQTHGEHHPAVADQYLAIAHIYILLGRNDEGLGLCKRALEIKVKWYGENNPEVAHAYAKISIVYERLGQYQKVQDLLEKSVDIWKTVSGEDSQELAEVYQLLGNAVCKKGQYKKGLEYANKVIGIKEKHLGSNNPRLAADYVWHAETCHKLGQESDRKESLEKFIQIDIEKLHPNVDCVRVMLRVSTLLGEEQRVEKGWEYAQKGFEMCKNLAVPRVSAVYSQYYETIGRLRKAEGKQRAAMEDIKEAIAIKEKIKCKDYDVMAELYSLMGAVCEDSEQDERALDWYIKSGEIVEKYLNKRSLLMLKAFLDLTRVFKKLGKKEESMEKLKAGYTLMLNLDLKDDHPLAKSYLALKQQIMEKGEGRKYSSST